ncbi:hypothetical protein ACFOY5_09470 [Massilia aurea]|uniref:hypothetical protein n=1 Tax=Massilia aurea TaxID=373040 RepID=UPI0021634566|nr:hypothetical protein [Massilia aurea]MCS0710081.1 hypothetical protein [Massilia aurea]
MSNKKVAMGGGHDITRESIARPSWLCYSLAPRRRRRLKRNDSEEKEGKKGLTKNEKHFIISPLCC